MTESAPQASIPVGTMAIAPEAFIMILALIALMLTVILIPVSFVGFFVVGLAAIILPIVGAVKASDGEYYSYPVVGTQP